MVIVCRGGLLFVEWKRLFNMSSDQDISDAPVCSKSDTVDFRAQKRAKSTCKAKFTRFSNQLLRLMDSLIFQNLKRLQMFEES